MGFDFLVLKHVFNEANIVQHEPTWEPKRAILGVLGASKPYFRNNCAPWTTQSILPHQRVMVVKNFGVVHGAQLFRK